MKRRRLIWRLLPAYLLVALVGALCIAWFAGRAVHAYEQDRVTQDLEARLALAVLLVESTSGGESATEMYRRLAEIAKAGRVRLAWVDADGRMVADSSVLPRTNGAAPSASGSPRGVAQALQQHAAGTPAISRHIEDGTIYLTQAVARDGRLVGALQASATLDDLSAVVGSVRLRMIIGVALLALAAMGTMMWLITLHISRPLNVLQRGARRLAAGNAYHPIPIPELREIGELTEAVNEMGSDLDEKLRTITQQSHERQAILAAMIEGVLAVDLDQRIITMNNAAARLTGVDPAAAQGRLVAEVIRNRDILDFINRAMESDHSIEGEIRLLRDDGTEQYMNAHGAVLHDQPHRSAGVVIVIQDVTRLRHLEQIRQQFVANVSHELRTPITAIKAAVETLIEDARPQVYGHVDGRGDAHVDPARRQADRFMAMIARQADRLNAIVEDLLTLARIEQGEGREAIELRRGLLQPVLKAATETCSAKAAEKQIRLDVSMQEASQARINPPLLEQAVVNLLDNAIKYSPIGSSARLTVSQADGEITIEVSDDGPGIAAEHLPRLFERFYRTDKARSREVGGTGLGLSIVKHVAQAHGGHVTVDSAPGRGSRFRIHLPAS